MASAPPVTAFKRQAIFGGFDGTSSLLGVVVFLLITHPALIFGTALSGALSSALSMGAGEWLSDSDSGLGASAVMAGATFCGGLLPALPFAFSQGPSAVAACGVICVCLAVAVAAMREHRGLGLAATETIGLLVVIAGVTAGYSAAFGGGAA